MRENEKDGNCRKLGAKKNFIKDPDLDYSVAWGFYSVPTIQNYKNM